MEKFILYQQMYEGSWHAQHALNAGSAEEALSIAKNWARYHSIGVQNVKVMEPNGDQTEWQVDSFWNQFKD